MADTYSNQGGFVDGALSGVRQQVEGQIGQAIDHYASHVPGGHQFTPEAKQAIAGILNGLQSQLENQAASRLGGLGAPGAQGAQHQGTQGNQGNNGGIL